MLGYFVERPGPAWAMSADELDLSKMCLNFVPRTIHSRFCKEHSFRCWRCWQRCYCQWCTLSEAANESNNLNMDDAISIRQSHKSRNTYSTSN